MRKTAALLLLLALVSLLSPAPSQAATLPFPGHRYFVGTSDELFRIVAGIAHIAGYEQDAWELPSAYTYQHTLLPPPLGLGAIDCLDSYYAPNQGPYDGAEDYLGMSTIILIDGVEVGVEIPSLDDLVPLEDIPGECYGFLFARVCVDYDWAQVVCADPSPEPAPDAGLDGGP